MVLEVVVRPVVFPNIRPARPRLLTTPDNPDQGIVVLGGGSGTFVGTSYSFSYSYSRSKPHKEKKRQVDKKRVYQKEADGSINTENYVDIEQMKKVLLQGKEPQRIVYGEYPDENNVVVLEKDITKISGKI